MPNINLHPFKFSSFYHLITNQTIDFFLTDFFYKFEQICPFYLTVVFFHPFKLHNSIIFPGKIFTTLVVTVITLSIYLN